jgi:pectate lyase
MLFLSTPAVRCQTLSFPGADGFGKFATGGRGGRVITVTNLNDDGPGSLRKAIQARTPRFIVFAVSGNIELKSPLDINYGNVTIAGQTAPGDGICIKNYTVSIKADNVILRFLRFRMGDEAKYEGDALSGTRRNRNIIIDHCSVSWATDECASFYGNEDFTLQWCIVAESLNQSVHSKGAHGYGGIWGGRKASFHHNLIASHASRLPRFSGSATTPNDENELVDFRNNVIYNWMNNNVYGGEKGKYNIVNNYFKPGPASKASARRYIFNPWRPYGKAYLEGNVLEKNEAVSRDNRTGIKDADPDSVLVSEPLIAVPAEMETAKESYDLVLALAGASLRRDAVDLRIVGEVADGSSGSGKNKNGIIDSQKDVGGWPVLQSLAPPEDADADGMSDDWERKNHLDPKDPTDACKRSISAEYDNIEIWLNRLADHIVSQHSY